MSGLNLMPMLLPNPEASQLPEGQGRSKGSREGRLHIHLLYPFSKNRCISQSDKKINASVSATTIGLEKAPERWIVQSDSDSKAGPAAEVMLLLSLLHHTGRLVAVEQTAIKICSYLGRVKEQQAKSKVMRYKRIFLITSMAFGSYPVYPGQPGRPGRSYAFLFLQKGVLIILDKTEIVYK